VEDEVPQFVGDLDTFRKCEVEGCRVETTSPTGRCREHSPIREPSYEMETDIWGTTTFRARS